MKKILFALILCLITIPLFAANYALEVTQPQPSLNTANRYYKAYTGLEYKVRVGVIGGLYPYVFSLTANPDGMTIDAATGIITWTAASVVEAGSPHAVTVSVTDQENTTVTRSWTITVNTTGAYFLDAVAGHTVANGGLGTAASPWQTLDDLLEAGTVSDNTIAYFKTGTYDTTGLAVTDSADQSVGGYGDYFRVVNAKPNIWVAYPGQSPIINFGSTAYDDPAPFIVNEDTDLYVSGFTISGCFNMCFQKLGSRAVFAWNTFTDLRGGYDGSNSAMIMTAGAGVNARYYTYMHNNSFGALYANPAHVGGSFLKLYGETKSIIEANTFDNTDGTASDAMEGIAWKAYNTYSVMRKNTVTDTRTHSIGGNSNYNANMTYEFNLVKDCGDSVYGVIINSNGTVTTPEYWYRNTFACPVNIRNVGAGNGPFTFTNNVFQNAASTYTGLTYYNVTVPSRIARADDLYGASGIVDADGLLTGESRTTYLGTRGWETTGDETPAEDITAPTLTTKTINSLGTTLTLVFNENISIGAGGNGGFTLTPSGGAATVSFSSSSATSLVYTISRTIQQSETVTISYTQPTNGVEDTAGNDLANITDSAVTNSSTQIPSPNLPPSVGGGCVLSAGGSL